MMSPYLMRERISQGPFSLQCSLVLAMLLRLQLLHSPDAVIPPLALIRGVRCFGLHAEIDDELTTELVSERGVRASGDEGARSSKTMRKPTNHATHNGKLQ